MNEEQLVVYPAVRRLNALLDRGLQAVPGRVRRALDDDDYSRALSEANHLYARRGPSDSLAVIVYGCLLVGRELVVEARGLLDKAIAADGQRPEYVALTADALVLAGDPNGADAWLDRLSSDDIDRPQVAAFVADVYLDIGEEEQAIDYYQLAVDAGYEDVETAIRLGQLYLGDERLEEAARAFEYGARIGGDRRGLWRMTADLWLELGDTKRGLLARRRLFELEETSADQWHYLGLRLAGVRCFDEALEAIERAHKLAPDDPEPILSRGHVLLELGRAEEAMAAFERLEKMEGDSADVDRGMAAAALLLGDLGLAERRAERAVANHPQDPDAHHTLGVIHQELGHHEQALEAFDEALAIDDTRPSIWQSRALSLAAFGRAEEALDGLQRAVELDPDALAGALDLALAFIKRGELDDARQAVECVEASREGWTLMRNFVEAVVSLIDEKTRADATAGRLEERLEQRSKPAPIELDVPEWRRIARSLDEEKGRRMQRWLDEMSGEGLSSGGETS